MRYYQIVLTDMSGNPVQTWTSHPNGIYQPPDPGALDVQFDLLAYEFAPQSVPNSQSGINAQDWVRIAGIPLPLIGQANAIAGFGVSISGGMGKGLPLANPAQAGLLVQGMVWNPFGNWIDTAMTLEFFVTAAPSVTLSGSQVSAARPLVFQWRAGTPLAQAVQQTLTTAYPGYQAQIAISSNLVLNHDEIGVYRTLPQFTAMLRRITQPILGGSYSGVAVTLLPGKTFRVYDGTAPAAPKSIAFADLVGQPTWIGFNQIQVTTVMRADLQVGDQVTLPPSLITTTPAAMNSYSQGRQGSIFQGTAQINTMRHTGNFRSPNAQDWVSIFEMIVQPQATQ